MVEVEAPPLPGQEIRDAIDRARWSIREVAEALNLSHPTLVRLFQKMDRSEPLTRKQEGYVRAVREILKSPGAATYGPNSPRESVPASPPANAPEPAASLPVPQSVERIVALSRTIHRLLGMHPAEDDASQYSVMTLSKEMTALLAALPPEEQAKAQLAAARAGREEFEKIRDSGGPSLHPDGFSPSGSASVIPPN